MTLTRGHGIALLIGLIAGLAIGSREVQSVNVDLKHMTVLVAMYAKHAEAVRTPSTP